MSYCQNLVLDILIGYYCEFVISNDCSKPTCLYLDVFSIQKQFSDSSHLQKQAELTFSCRNEC